MIQIFIFKDSVVSNGIESFFENPLNIIAEAFGLNIKISFENVAENVNFSIKATEYTDNSSPLFSSWLWKRRKPLYEYVFEATIPSSLRRRVRLRTRTRDLR